YPPPNSSPIADAIRERRGARGLSPLDGTLLNVPAFAEGWNTLLGAVRTKGKLGGDVREIMILRVAALNHAAFEWIHHEHVARDAGLTTEQLYLVRDTTYTGEEEETDSILSPLQRAALAFAHYSTSTVKVPAKVTLTLAAALSTADPSFLVECASIVSSYNMVSRFLVSLDVAGMSSSTVPWPHTKSTHRIPLPDEDGAYLHAETYVTDDKDGEWVVCSNSLLTNTGMWEWALGGLYKTYNVLLFDQRGHGKSSSGPGLQCTIPLLASDIAFLISSIIMPSGSSIRASTDSVPPVHAVIGVSQGGASALAFAAMYPGLAKAVVACDTGPRTPEGNKQAWEERIQLANSDGMEKLAEVTLPRWFPSPSNCSMKMYPIGEQITSTSLQGFALGASALMDYNLIDGVGMSRKLLDSGAGENDPKVLLVAGSLDGAEEIKLEVIEGAGHLPMVDE
ncbi:alpha/beta-hydrolase, partial [Gymnopus androsaceus JB14]